MKTYRSSVRGVLCGLAVAVIPSGWAGDWPQYRGPNTDGVSPEYIRTNWAEQPPQVVWKVPLSPALSSFAVAGGKAYTQGRRTVGSAQREFCIALNADTGAEIWAKNLDLASYSGGYGDGSDDGPRTTPAVDGERVYVLTSQLKLFCLNAGEGSIVWSNSLTANFAASVIGWQNAASPVVVGDVVLVNCNGRANEHLIGFRKTDGFVLWKTGSDGLTHASPVVATIDGVQQVVFFAQTGLVGVEPATGQVLWRYPVSFNGTSTGASPVVAGNLVYCSQAYSRGAALCGVTNTGGTFTATTVLPMTNNVLQNHWATPVYYRSNLYGIYGSSSTSLRCVDMRTKSTRWSVSHTRDAVPYNFGSTLVVGNRILAVTGDDTFPVSSCVNGGMLVLIEPNPAAYTEIARFRPLTGRVWNVPAVSNGRIYIRSTLEGACVDVSYPRLKLRPSVTAGPGGLQLTIANESGLPLTTNRATNIQVLASSVMSTNPLDWAPVTNVLVLTNGVLQLEDASSGTPPRRFFKGQEQP